MAAASPNHSRRGSIKIPGKKISGGVVKNGVVSSFLRVISSIITAGSVRIWVLTPPWSVFGRKILDKQKFDFKGAVKHRLDSFLEGVIESLIRKPYNPCSTRFTDARSAGISHTISREAEPIPRSRLGR